MILSQNGANNNFFLWKIIFIKYSYTCTLYNMYLFQRNIPLLYYILIVHHRFPFITLVVRKQLLFQMTIIAKYVGQYAGDKM